MDAIQLIYISFIVTFSYLICLIIQKRYRLLLPSILHSFIWCITSLLIICELNGYLVTNKVEIELYDKVTKFIFLITISSVIGFSLAHLFTLRVSNNKVIKLIDPSYIDTILNNFKWIPWLCGIVGMLLFIYIITSVGSIDSFSDFRVIALSTERVGYGYIVQRISGHINILGGFYLMLLGYKYGQTGIKKGNFIKYILLCSAINISIGGRVWILTSTLPFLILYFYSNRYSYNNPYKKKDKKTLIVFMLIFVILFSLIGLFRGNGEEHNFIDKFLYLTDGSKMTNIILNTYKEGFFEYEYGKSTLLQYFVPSSMVKNFADLISHDIGLSVTVKSVMPNLYYDFGLLGGAFFWGIMCFLIEFICIKLKYNLCSIIKILLFGQLSILLFQSPVGNVFSLYTTSFLWLAIIYIFKPNFSKKIL